MNKINLLFGALLLASLSTLAQSSITGRVLNQSQEAQGYVNVLLLQASDSSLVKGRVTSEDGSFTFEKQTPGAYLLSCSAIGYQTWYSDLIQLNNQAVELGDILLSTDDQVLDAVEVVAKKPLYVQEIDRTVINVKNSITNAGSDALDILERSPGVTVDRVNNVINLLGKEGVIVMINGKRTRLDMAAVIQMLAGMDAGNIEKIELITTPPANFDADGDAGFINIVLVKRTEEGLNGSFNGTLGYGDRIKSGAGLNINYAKNKMNVYANLSAQYDLVQHQTRINRFVFTKDNETQTFSDSDRPALESSYRGNIGLDYQLSEKTSLGIMVSGYYRYWDLDGQTTGFVRDSEGEGYQSNLQSLEVNERQQWLTNIHFGHQWSEKTSISFDLDYLNFEDDNPTDYIDQQTTLDDQPLNSDIFRSHKVNPLEFWVGKIDVQHRWTDKLNMEAGLKGTLSDFFNENRVTNFENEQWTINPTFTSQHELDEKIGAAYTSFTLNLDEKTEIKAGVRYEYIDSDLREADGESVALQQYGRWFPSAFVSRQLTDDLHLQVAYSERITRPAFNNLAPALFFWNPTTLLSGNPAIQPAFTKQFKVDLRYKTISFTAQYSYDEQPITWGQPEVDPESNLMINVAQNMKDRKSLMLSLSSPINWSSRVTSRLSGTAFGTSQRPIFEGRTLENSFWWFSANMTSEVKVTDQFTAELSGNYHSDGEPGVGRFLSRWQLNLAVSQALKKNNGRLSLTWTDIFKTANFFQMVYDDRSLGFISDWKYQTEGSIVQLTYSQSFGNQKIRKAKQRQGGSSEERRRIN